MNKRGKMKVSDRAKQFMPFAALKGLPEALRQKEKIVVQKVELSEEYREELDRLLREVKRGDIVTVICFDEGEYIKVTGMVAMIDMDNKIIQLANRRISADLVLDIKPERKHI